VTAKVVRAQILLDAAWDARGDGWASEVSQDGWELFKDYLKQAPPLLTELPDPAACAIRVDVATGLGEPFEVVEQAVKRSEELNPQDNDALTSTANYLLARWHGGNGRLAQYIEDTMKRRGDAVLVEFLGNYELQSSIIEELPYDLVDRGLSAAEAESPGKPRLLRRRANIEVHYGNKEKARIAVEALAKHKETDVSFEFDRESWNRFVEAGPSLPIELPEVIEHGQYANVLPAPRLIAPSDTLPLIPGRSLGIRLRYLEENTRFARREIILDGPDGRQTRTEYVRPNARKKGMEELVLWDLTDKDKTPGIWTLSVTEEGRPVASQSFTMVDGQGRVEPGLRLIYKGRLQMDPTLGIRYPADDAETIPAQLGTSFGFQVRYIGLPKSAVYNWVYPADSQGRRKMEPYELNLEKFPSYQMVYSLEQPHELVKGTWHANAVINGKNLGGVTFEVR
jgi:hypothetical protein